MKYIRNLFRDTTNSNINYDKTYILSFISPNIIEKIRLNQKLFMQYNELRKNTECFICLEEDFEYVPLQCKHIICEKCYNDILDNGWKKCPLCMTPLIRITISENWCIMTYTSRNDIGIIYLPSIYDNELNKNIEYDIIFASQIYDQQHIIIKLMIRLILQKYVLYANNNILKLLKSIDSDIYNELIFVKTL